METKREHEEAYPGTKRRMFGGPLSESETHMAREQVKTTGLGTVSIGTTCKHP